VSNLDNMYGNKQIGYIESKRNLLPPTPTTNY